jgi:hypothetical protein
MTTHKKCSNRYPTYGFNTDKLLDTTVKVVELGVISNVAVAVLKH